MIFPKVIFTNSNQIDSVDKLQGQFLVCKDTEKVFIDIKDGQRIGITDKAIQAAVSSAGKNAIKSLSIEDNILTYVTGDGQTRHYNIEDKDTTYDPATTTTDGLMSAADKNKLNGIATGANNYSLPLASSTARGGVRIGYAANGKNYPVQLKDEQMFVNVPWTDTNTTYGNMTAATASAAGKAGLVPAPAAGKQTSFLRGDGTWVIPTNTTYTAATLPPLVAGTATVGTSSKYAREDHIHPAQTTISGNAGSATKLATARKINGVAFDGTADILIPNGSISSVRLPMYNSSTSPNVTTKSSILIPSGYNKVLIYTFSAEPQFATIYKMDILSIFNIRTSTSFSYTQLPYNGLGKISHYGTSPGSNGSVTGQTNTAYIRVGINSSTITFDSGTPPYGTSYTSNVPIFYSGCQSITIYAIFFKV